MKTSHIAALAAALGLAGLGPQPSAAKTCEELVVGNGYACEFVTKSLFDRAEEPGSTVCFSFTDVGDESDGLVALSGEGVNEAPCSCGSKGRLTNPKLGESTEITCLDDRLGYLTAKATGKGLKKGFAFTAKTEVLFDCRLDPTCIQAPAGCGLSGNTCGGECPAGQTCLVTGSGSIPRGTVEPTCGCVDEALECAAVSACIEDGLCGSTFEICRPDDDTGECRCENVVQ